MLLLLSLLLLLLYLVAVACIKKYLYFLSTQYFLSLCNTFDMVSFNKACSSESFHVILVD